MCGITGIFDTRGKRDFDPAVLHRMNQAQLHRGPDEGRAHGAGPGLRAPPAVHHRSATGQQPLFNADGSVVIVFNGEIYNYQELIPELQAWVMCFAPAATPKSSCTPGKPGARTASTGCAACLPSRIWDRNSETFFMARDRLASSPCTTRCSTTAACCSARS
jgi:asparagine synthase (glutamine-hydrolysing)